MKEKFINFNCAQMAAVSLWMLFTSLNLTCKLNFFKKVRDIELTVYMNYGAKVEIPKGYCYSSKTIYDFEKDEKTNAFRSIVFTFEYSRKEDKA